MIEENKERSSSSDEKSVNVAEEQKKSMENSLEVLHRLSEFSSKREPVMSRLADISRRMEERLKKSYERGVDGEEFDPDKIPTPPKNETEEIEKRRKEFIHEHPQLNTRSLKFMRCRDVEAPVVAGGYNCNIVFYVPTSQELNDGKHFLNDSGVFIGKTGDSTFDSLALGVSVSIPANTILVLELTQEYKRRGFSLVTPRVVFSHDASEEIVLTLTNNNTDESKHVLEYSTPAVIGTLVDALSLSVEELLPSTYKTYVLGGAH